MIVVFGSLNIDLVMPVSRFPQPGETVLCATDYLSRAGGKGSNQAVAAARAGAKVAFVGKVGDDSFGRRSINNLKNHSIWTAGIGISERPTGCATIAVDSDGRNFILVAPGANLDVTSDQMPDEVFHDKNIILCQFEVSNEETLKVLARAKKKGAVTILNASPAPAVPRMDLQNIDYFIVNELEAHQFARNTGLDAADVNDLVQKLARSGNMTCIITMEGKGSVASKNGDGVFAVGALPVEVVDSTGAGDTFCGVFAASLQAGHDWLEALHRASVGASLSCLGLGAQGATPALENIEDRLSEVAKPHRII